MRAGACLRTKCPSRRCPAALTTAVSSVATPRAKEAANFHGLALLPNLAPCQITPTHLIGCEFWTLNPSGPRFLPEGLASTARGPCWPRFTSNMGVSAAAQRRQSASPEAGEMDSRRSARITPQISAGRGTDCSREGYITLARRMGSPKGRDPAIPASESSEGRRATADRRSRTRYRLCSLGGRAVIAIGLCARSEWATSNAGQVRNT